MAERASSGRRSLSGAAAVRGGKRAGDHGRDGGLVVSAHGIDKSGVRRSGVGGGGNGGGGGGAGVNGGPPHQVVGWRRGTAGEAAATNALQSHPLRTACGGDVARANSAPTLAQRTSAGCYPRGGEGTGLAGHEAATTTTTTTAVTAAAAGEASCPSPPPKPPPPPPPPPPAALKGSGTGGGASGAGEKASPSFLDTWMYGGCRMTKGTAAERVSIHVHDEVNNVTRNFICRRTVLLREMCYFKTYLSHECSIDDLDISVHCDVSIFKWLMEYVHNEREARPQPDPAVAVSILISSDFLQMSELVEESLQYVHDHVQEIIKLPIDLDCINRPLVGRLAALFTYDELDRVRDRKDKLLGALFLHKIHSLLRTTDEAGNPCNVLFRCALCSTLFTDEQRSFSVCERSAPVITFHGESIAEHVVDARWDVSAYVASLRSKRLSWKEVFWRLWAVVQHDVCKVCGRGFVVAEIGHCSYHQALPRFELGSSTGVFPCCGAEVQRFEGGTVRQGGCCARSHILSNTAQKEFIMSVISRHPYILIPRSGAGRTTPTAAAAAAVAASSVAAAAAAPVAQQAAQAACEGAAREGGGGGGAGGSVPNSIHTPAQDTSADDTATSASSEDDTFGPDWRRRSRWASWAGHSPFGCADPARHRRTSRGGQRSGGGVGGFPGAPLSVSTASTADARPPASPLSSATTTSASDRGPTLPAHAGSSAASTARHAAAKRRKKKGGGGGSGGGGGCGGGGEPRVAAASGMGGTVARGAGEPGSVNGPSNEWWYRLGAKGRQAYLVDVQRDTDEKRMQALLAQLAKRRVDADKPDRVTSASASKKVSLSCSGKEGGGWGGERCVCVCVCIMFTSKKITTQGRGHDVPNASSQEASRLSPSTLSRGQTSKQVVWWAGMTGWGYGPFSPLPLSQSFSPHRFPPSPTAFPPYLPLLLSVSPCTPPSSCSLRRYFTLQEPSPLSLSLSLSLSPAPPPLLHPLH